MSCNSSHPRLPTNLHCCPVLLSFKTSWILLIHWSFRLSSNCKLKSFQQRILPQLHSTTIKFNNLVSLSHWEKNVFHFSNGDFFVTIFCSEMLKQIYSCFFFFLLLIFPFHRVRHRKMNNTVIPSGTRRETWFLLEFIAVLFLSSKNKS